MDGTIDELAAQLAITNVVCRLAICTDQGGLDDYLDAFVAEAELVLPIGTLQGRTELRELAESRRATGTGGPGSNSRHVVTTVSVAMAGPDEAEALSYFSYFEMTATAPVLVSIGTYRDLFRRTGGTWRIARRNVAIG